MYNTIWRNKHSTHKPISSLMNWMHGYLILNLTTSTMFLLDRLVVWTSAVDGTCETSHEHVLTASVVLIWLEYVGEWCDFGVCSRGWSWIVYFHVTRCQNDATLQNKFRLDRFIHILHVLKPPPSMLRHFEASIRIIVIWKLVVTIPICFYAIIQWA